MKILIDGDGCPVIPEAERAASLFHLESVIVCDTSHLIRSDKSKVIVVDKGADSADFTLTGLIRPGDIVITQDYGLAAMALAKKACPFHQNGWQYTNENIGRLLMERYEAKKARKSAKHHLKGPAKRKREDNEKFYRCLADFLKKWQATIELTSIPGMEKKLINGMKTPVESCVPVDEKEWIPNETTRKALAEAEEMKKHPEKYKVYDTFDELMEDIHKEDGQ